MRKVFYIWMVLITYLTVSPFFSEPLPLGLGINVLDYGNSGRIVASASGGGKIIWIIGGLVSIGICILWLFFSKNRIKRSLAGTIPGVILFMVGSVLVGRAPALEVNMSSVFKARNLPLGQVNPIFYLVIGSLTLVGSYFLCFRKKK